MKKTYLFLCACASTLSVFAQTNLASGATASAVVGSASAASAIDGNTSTRWEASADDISSAVSASTISGDQDVTWTLDLGEAKTFNTIKILWEGAYSKSYDIKTSTDGTTYSAAVVAVADVTPALSPTYTTHKFEATTARYIRFENVARGTGYGVSFWEFEVYNIDYADLRLTAVKPGSPFVALNSAVSLTAFDQYGDPIAEGVTYSVPEGSGTLSGSTFTPSVAGPVTVTASAGGLSATTQVYVVAASNMPAAPSASAVQGALFTPGYTSGTEFIGQWDEKATPYDAIVAEGRAVKPVGAAGTLWIANSTVSAPLNGKFFAGSGTLTEDQTYTGKNYGKLHVELFPLTAASGTLYVQGAAQENTPLELPAQQWTTVEVALPAETLTGNVGLKMQKTGEAYPDLLLANLFFTPLVADTDNHIASLSAAQTFAVKGEAVDLGLVAKNANGRTIDEGVAYTSDKGTYADGKFTFTEAGTATVTGTTNVDASVRTATTTVTVLSGSAKAPDADAADVLAVYCDTYGATSALAENNGQRGSIALKDWNGGYGAALQVALAGDDHLVFVSDAVGFGMHTGGADLSGYDYLNLSVYPSADFSGSVRIEGTDMAREGYFPVSLKAGQWNDLRLALAGSRTAATWIQLVVGSGESKNNVFIDNIYFSKRPEGAVDIAAADAKGFVKITGTVTSANKHLLAEAEGKVIDLRGASLAGDVAAIGLQPNQLLLVACTSSTQDNDAGRITSAQAAQLTGNTRNVIVTDGNYYWAATPVAYTDDNARQPAAISINTLSQGYTITRSIPAGKYVSAATAAATQAPEGIGVYAFTAYSAADGLTFSKVADGRMDAKTPYVLHNPSAEAADLVTTGTGDLNLTVDARTVTPEGSSVSLVANLTAIVADGTQYALQNATEGIVFRQAVSPAVIGAFRAYLTGVPQGGAVKVMLTDTTTSVGGAAGRTTATSAVFDLAGRRVEKPAKGIYVVGGRKVVRK